MRAGTLRHRVVLYERQLGQDTMGQPTEALVAFGRDYAEINQPGGREFFNAQHHLDITDVVLRMRYRADLNPKHVIELEARGQQYEVTAVADPTMKMRELYILAKRVMT